MKARPLLIFELSELQDKYTHAHVLFKAVTTLLTAWRLKHDKLQRLLGKRGQGCSCLSPNELARNFCRELELVTNFNMMAFYSKMM